MSNSYSIDNYPKNYEWLEEIIENDTYIDYFEKDFSFSEEELVHMLVYFYMAEYDLKWCAWVISKLSDEQIINLIQRGWSIDTEFVFHSVSFDRACRIAKKIDNNEAYLMLWYKIDRNSHLITCIRRWRRKHTFRKNILF